MANIHISWRMRTQRQGRQHVTSCFFTACQTPFRKGVYILRKATSRSRYFPYNVDRISEWEPTSVAQLDMLSDWRPGGCGFNPCQGLQHSFVEIDHEIFSRVILSLPLIQEGQLSVSGDRICTILVNRL